MNKYIILFVVLFKVLCSTLYGQTVYLSEATRKPFERIIFIDNKGDILRYTTFYKGVLPPKQDIHVEFLVEANKAMAFNVQNNTDYKMLPRGSYNLELTSEIIAKGSVSAPSGEIKIIDNNYLKPFEKYILPITVKVTNGQAEADADLSTIYYVIQAVPAPNTITNKQIGRLPSETKYIFGFGSKYLIASDNNGQLTVYEYTGRKLHKGLLIKGSENLKEMDNILNFRDHHIVGLNRTVNKGQLWSFPISSDASKISPVDKIFGTFGYADFSEIISLGNNLYCLLPSGELKIYPLSDSMEWSSPGVRSLGSGWNYPILFGYGNSLIAIDARGDMWKYILSNNRMPGIPVRIGTGWSRFAQIAVVGGDLLALDTNGVLWQIRFNEKGFWAL